MKSRNKFLGEIQFEGLQKNAGKFNKLNMHITAQIYTQNIQKTKTDFAFLQFSFQRIIVGKIAVVPESLTWP